ncbi:hypothetical protein EVAR_64695_1 [Eumeta japonica]|uniref:Uncharacterized protein n=1 Tax=Eumeta variegata TaxID=151549 RepID=A0A4C1ZK44_EUMVA|nr:hypothetical protein EVAR_64695_1 [Eumeta japonica]
MPELNCERQRQEFLADQAKGRREQRKRMITHALKCSHNIISHIMKQYDDVMKPLCAYKTGSVPGYTRSAFTRSGIRQIQLSDSPALGTGAVRRLG